MMLRHRVMPCSEPEQALREIAEATRDFLSTGNEPVSTMFIATRDGTKHVLVAFPLKTQEAARSLVELVAAVRAIAVSARDVAAFIAVTSVEGFVAKLYVWKPDRLEMFRITSSHFESDAIDEDGRLNLQALGLL